MSFDLLIVEWSSFQREFPHLIALLSYDLDLVSILVSALSKLHRAHVFMLAFLLFIRIFAMLKVWEKEDQEEWQMINDKN